ncbi:prepilin-type N-terminal cleavage/methylation domain-containing protein [Planctomycetota bacterium]|nr:prepilin-type N-terminal cleavage/methylation domain-containing protein [Planctomycetota bacterium]
MRTLKRGFTLLELMIAITLMMIIMLMLQQMFTNASMLYTTAAKRATIYSQARVAMDLIEQDMLRMRASEEAPLTMRSLEPLDYSNVDESRNGKHFTVMTDWVEAEDDASTKIHEFLSFPGTNSWYDKTLNDGAGGYRTGQALVVYYLRKRMPTDDVTYEGAYLVRRLIPIRSLAEIARAGNPAAPGGGRPLEDIHATEEEICSFVCGVRMFVDDQGAVMYNRRNNNKRKFEIMPLVHQDMRNKWNWMDTQANPPLSSKPPVGGVNLILPVPPEEHRAEYGGIWQTYSGVDRDFASPRWNYPSTVMVEITLNDKFMERNDNDSTRGLGTYRTFSRAVQLPISGPMNNLDETDAKYVK